MKIRIDVYVDCPDSNIEGPPNMGDKDMKKAVKRHSDLKRAVQSVLKIGYDGDKDKHYHRGGYYIKGVDDNRTVSVVISGDKAEKCVIVPDGKGPLAKRLRKALRNCNL